MTDELEEERNAAKNGDMAAMICVGGLLVLWGLAQWYFRTSQNLEIADGVILFLGTSFLLVYGIFMQWTRVKRPITALTPYAELFKTALIFAMSNTVGYYYWASGFKSMKKLDLVRYPPIWNFLAVSVFSILISTIFALLASTGQGKNAWRKGKSKIADQDLTETERRTQYGQMSIVTGTLLAILAAVFRSMIMNRLLEENAEVIYTKIRDISIKKFQKIANVTTEDDKRIITAAFENITNAQIDKMAQKAQKIKMTEGQLPANGNDWKQWIEVAMAPAAATTPAAGGGGGGEDAGGEDAGGGGGGGEDAGGGG